MAGACHGDIWHEWLRTRRSGGDGRCRQAVQEALVPIRDRVLAHAALAEGDLLLDVGCGDGLIALGALERCPSCRAILSDISQPLLDEARRRAEALGVLARCQFVRASAEDLAPIADSSVDVVTTRSVLIYVARKQDAFRAFARVLKPGGRLSIFEPINAFAHPEPPDRFWGYDVSPVAEIAAKLKAHYRALRPTNPDPMLDFHAWDLVRFAAQAGFDDIRLHVEAGRRPHTPRRWETFLRRAPNPQAPTLEEAMRAVLAPAEQAAFAAHLRPLVEAGEGARRLAVAYLWARRA